MWILIGKLRIITACAIQNGFEQQYEWTIFAASNRNKTHCEHEIFTLIIMAPSQWSPSNRSVNDNDNG